jgi:SPP1 family predicted phage head-tail adaptor
MNPRQLNKLIDVLRKQTAQDASGQEVATAWPKLHRKLPAEVEEVSGGKTQRGRQVEATVTTVVTIRNLRDLTPEDRVAFDGRTLSIVRTMDPDGKSEWLEIHCSEVR